ncbi:aminodeoxychorismate synthase component I [Amylibacter sp. SFDW26]|uniref:aminodeoxychorismate synthase component I n=1 Tax=Amylibacter sp. SFDW26 TaxID=2652722 RepID=UPI0012624035|nr:aminodeoxychorismate synthase component I [Amylibacter sp. SFDW26]KAB7610414.1 aminodeoxychorismate synthase component I [Amylibacter sp. SFDW26]
MSESYILFDEGPDGGTQAFADPERLIVAWEPEEVADALNAMQKARADGKWLAGTASYELGYVLEPKLLPRLPKNRHTPLICFGVFDGPDANAARSLAHRGRSEQADAKLDAPTPVWSADEYEAAFGTVKDYISAGDFYQTNLTFPMRSKYEGSALGLYTALRRAQPVKHGALVHLGEGPVFVSRSPELFFRVSAEGVIETRPMKGTVRRGNSQAEDDELVAFLGSDPKNRAENLMIVDLLRNDISRIAKVGSVKVPELFTVETYATVHQMTSLVRAELVDDVTVSDMFHALFPCGSITGAPKIRAMEVINDLEVEARDIYCGSIGWIAPDGRSSFNVAIRTLTLLDDDAVSLNVGGGVVYDSTAASEYEEALWKARYTKLLQTD